MVVLAAACGSGQRGCACILAASFLPALFLSDEVRSEGRGCLETMGVSLRYVADSLEKACVNFGKLRRPGGDSTQGTQDMGSD